jgi:predicted nucleic acid-binding protein
LVTAAGYGEFALLLPENVIEEVRVVVALRPHLAARVSRDVVEALFRRLLEFAIPIPLLELEPPQVSRDANDDYLIALGVMHAADFIVTRDKDLLDLGDVAGVRIVDPVTFLAFLRTDKEDS